MSRLGPEMESPTQRRAFTAVIRAAEAELSALECAIRNLACLASLLASILAAKFSPPTSGLAKHGPVHM